MSGITPFAAGELPCAKAVLLAPPKPIWPSKQKRLAANKPDRFIGVSSLNVRHRILYVLHHTFSAILIRIENEMLQYDEGERTFARSY